MVCLRLECCSCGAARSSVETQDRGCRGEKYVERSGPLHKTYIGAFSGFRDPQHGENARLVAANRPIGDPKLAYVGPWVPVARAEAGEMVWGLVIGFG